MDFPRMFFYMTNISVSEYVRRRMSLAAVDLQEVGVKIIDVALKYGYDSPTAFNRAFQSIHGIAPSLAKKESTTLKSYPAIKFSILVQGMEEMNFRIEAKEAFRIVGKSCPLSKALQRIVIALSSTIFRLQHGQFFQGEEPIFLFKI